MLTSFAYKVSTPSSAPFLLPKAQGTFISFFKILFGRFNFRSRYERAVQIFFHSSLLLYEPNLISQLLLQVVLGTKPRQPTQ